MNNRIPFRDIAQRVPAANRGWRLHAAVRGPSGRAVSWLVALATFALFLPACSFDFLTWDDPFYVSRNPLVVGGVTPRKVIAGIAAVVECNWAPVTILSYQIDACAFGDAPWGFHLSNIAYHAAAVGLLCAALGSMTGQMGRSAAAAFLFAVHPLRVESVAWISERKDVLSVLFLSCTLLAYDRYTRNPSIARYGWVAAGMFASLASKATLVTLPFLLLLLDVWPLRRVSLAAGSSAPTRRPVNDDGAADVRSRLSLTAALREKVPLVFIALAMTAVTVAAQGRALAGNDGSTLLGDRLPNTVFATGWYVVKLIVPMNLCGYYPPATIAQQGSRMLAAAGLIVALLALAVGRFGQQPSTSFGIVWFFIALLPVCQIVQTGGHGYADRYSYVPHIGLCVAVVWAVADLLGSRGLGWKWGMALTVVVGLGLAVVTSRQLGVWRNDDALWRHALLVDRNNPHGNLHVGDRALAEGRVVEAEEYYRRAMRGGGGGLAAARLAIIYHATGDMLKRRPCIELALMTVPDDESVQSLLGRIGESLRKRAVVPAVAELVGQADLAAARGDEAQAMRHLMAAAALDQGDSEPCFLAAVTSHAGGSAATARAWVEQAIDRNPLKSEYRVFLSELVLADGDGQAALLQSELATRMDPGNRRAHRLRDACRRSGAKLPSRRELGLE